MNSQRKFPAFYKDNIIDYYQHTQTRRDDDDTLSLSVKKITGISPLRGEGGETTTTRRETQRGNNQ